MKKNTFYTAVLLLAGAIMTACSSSDDLTDNTTPDPQMPTEGNVVVLRGTLGSKGNVTRSYIDDEYGDGYWEEGDQFAIYYKTSNGGNASAVATVTSVSEEGEDYGSAEFTAELISPKTGSNNVTFVYPATAHDGKGGFKTDALKNQGGTMDYINKYLDIETAETTMNVEGTTATLTDDVWMQPEVCLCELFLYDITDFTISGEEKTYESLYATKLEIFDGENSYTITPANDVAINNFYVALLPTDKADITFKATTAKEVEAPVVYTKQNVTLATCTKDNVGHVFDKDGNIYSVSKGTTDKIIYSRTYSKRTLKAGNLYRENELKLSPRIGNDNVTPVAMIAYVGNPGTADASSTTYRGLAMAMDYAIDEKYGDELAWASYEKYDNVCTGISNESQFNYHRECNDMNGISNTNTLAGGCGDLNHVHPAARAAKNYSVAGFTPSVLGCSNWFLPSSGQWFKFFEACGVVLSDDWNRWGQNEDGQESPGGSADTALVLGKMNNAGVNYWYDDSYSDYFDLWTSSQASQGLAVDVSCHSNGGIRVSAHFKYAPGLVQPFIAF